MSSTLEYEATWVYLHRFPRKVAQTRPEFWSPHQRWLAERSLQRYDRRPNKTDFAPLFTGEIGLVVGFNVHTTSELPSVNTLDTKTERGLDGNRQT